MQRKYRMIFQENQRWAWMEKAEQGLYPSLAPVGYINNRNTRLIEVDEEKAPYIKRAFSLTAAGHHSLRMLERQLYDEGLRNRNDNWVGKSAIHQTLKNPNLLRSSQVGGAKCMREVILQ